MLGALIHGSRLARAGFVLAREGVFAAVDPSLVAPAMRLPLALARLIARPGAGANRIAIAMARLGPSYIKLGQFLATRPDVVGPAVVRELESLQDRAPPFSRDQAVATVQASLGAPIDTLFISFGAPVAAASIAQVHRARMRHPDGEREVAVKVVRPGVARRFSRDLADMMYAARFAERYFAEGRRLRMVEVVETLARSVRIEMDFRLEAAAASEFGENVADDPDFRVPAVEWERTGREVLTLGWVDGMPLSDMAALARSDHDLPALARTIIQSFLRHALRDGFFHADMHRGNLFVDATGRLWAVDFGIMGRLGPKERRFLAEILYGFITRDYMRVARVHFEAGYVPSRYRVEDFAQAIRAIGEPIHSRTADQISMAKLLTLLFEITAIFDMHTRTELVLLQKTMVVVEGVARALDPRLDMWAIAEPVVREWIERNLGPAGILEGAGQGVRALGRFVADLPDTLVRGEKILRDVEVMAAEGVDLTDESLKAIEGAQARAQRLGHWALWAIAALLALMWWR